MQDNPNTPSSAFSRRQFLKKSSLITASAAAAVSLPSALGAQTRPVLQSPKGAELAQSLGAPMGPRGINAVVIGLGGRGGGAGKNFLEAAKQVGTEARIVAVADIFPEAARKGVEDFGVPENKCFSGFDAFQKALAVPGVNYAILATPPCVRFALR